MQCITKDQAVTFKNADTCFGSEYSFDDKTMNVALITIVGRYPESGSVVNQISKELAYVTKGSGVVCTESETVELHEGDVVFIDANEVYYWDGDMTIITICSPAFDPEQHKEIKG